jgi:hypothetical protein
MPRLAPATTVQDAKPERSREHRTCITHENRSLLATKKARIEKEEGKQRPSNTGEQL